MTPYRWLNLLLWGLGDRMEGTDDYRSDLLLVADLLVWVGTISFLALEGPGLFLALWALAPASGQPIYWIGTQLIIGYLMTRGWKKKATPAAVQAKPQQQGDAVAQGPSEEP